MIGMRSRRVFVSCAEVSASRGNVPEYRGIRRTSSNVKPSETIFGVCMGKHTEVAWSGVVVRLWHGHCSVPVMHLNWRIGVVALMVILLSCSHGTQPSESDLGFADVMDVKISSAGDQVTCLLYVQAYSGCQEPRLVSTNQKDNSIELTVSTFKLVNKQCDTVQSVTKVWHTFSNLPDSSIMHIRIRSDKDTRTNKPTDTLIAYSRR